MTVRRGVLIISHGSREAGWVKLVDEAVAEARNALSREWPDVPVEAAFLELVEGRLIQDGIDALERAGVTRMYALPLFVSSGSTHVDEIGWALGAYPSARTETELEPFRLRASLEYGRPMDDDPELVDVLLDRLAVLSDGSPEREQVLLVAHGSEHDEFREAWQRGMRSLANAVRERGGYAAADIALLRPDQVAERLSAMSDRGSGGVGRGAKSDGGSGADSDVGQRVEGFGSIGDKDGAADVLVAPLFLSEGYFTEQVVPRRLASSGVVCRYDGRTLMPHPAVARWLVRRVRAWLNA